MEQIKITDDSREMIDIAKEIIKKEGQLYTPAMMAQIKRLICENAGGGVTDADAEFYKNIYYYWVHGCNPLDYYENRFSEKTHKEVKEYITMRYRVMYANVLNKEADPSVFENKSKAYETFKDFYKRDVLCCRDEGDLDAFLEFTEKHPRFIVKPVDMAEGDGIYIEDSTGMGREEMRELLNKILDTCSLHLKAYSYGKEAAVVIEELISQAEEMAVFHPASLNVVRIPTVRGKDKKIHIFYPWIKVSQGGRFLTSVKYDGIYACIDPVDGRIYTCGSSKQIRYERHPDTNIQFDGFQVPNWKELSDMVQDLCKVVPEAGYIGWDLALTKKGWCMVEGNFYGSFYSQAILGRGLRRELEELSGVRLEKDFWWQEDAWENRYLK